MLITTLKNGFESVSRSVWSYSLKELARSKTYGRQKTLRKYPHQFLNVLLLYETIVRLTLAIHKGSSTLN